MQVDQPSWAAADVTPARRLAELDHNDEELELLANSMETAEFCPISWTAAIGTALEDRPHCGLDKDAAFQQTDDAGMMHASHAARLGRPPRDNKAPTGGGAFLTMPQKRQRTNCTPPRFPASIGAPAATPGAAVHSAGVAVSAAVHSGAPLVGRFSPFHHTMRMSPCNSMASSPSPTMNLTSPLHSHGSGSLSPLEYVNNICGEGLCPPLLLFCNVDMLTPVTPPICTAFL